MATQRCGRCKQAKDQEAFSPSYRGKNGTWCRECFAAYQRGERGTTSHSERTCDYCGTAYIPAQLKTNAKFCSAECKALDRKASGAQRSGHLLRKYGISQADYDALLAAQGGGCALCGKTAAEQTRYTEFLHVDHDHVTGRVRGLLCDQHNLLLGRFNDDPALLRRAADYLEAPAS